MRSGEVGGVDGRADGEVILEGFVDGWNVCLDYGRRNVGELEVVDVERDEIVARRRNGLEVEERRARIVAAPHGVGGDTDLVPVAVGRNRHAGIAGDAWKTRVAIERCLQAHVDDVI